ncbi:potassium-transporting ATPase subunit KdpA [Actinomadura flavalba]|uniref:potassium-transporting ATPase subunit KdpA n=1 Tax=Actinomadura flavalba TaxID=1120938 RepID=UPI00037CF413|nr:potassium-transporting ATPase subunit KdpA [Actinomadura flavalba]
MSDTQAAVLFAGSLVVALAVLHVPLGDHLHRVFTSPRHTRAERLVYRAVGVDADAGQRWGAYARGVLAFSLVSVLFLYLFQRVQSRLPLALGHDDVPAPVAWNTAVSFVTNTNWQAYAGESTMGHLVQMAGLAVQNFVSAAVGLAVAIAFVRGFAGRGTGDLGNFWVDLTRAVLRVLLPLSAVAAVVLIAGGVVQNLDGAHTVTTLTGGTQTLPGGPVASQEAIKQLGTNGGGFYNANSAHPYENPSAWTSWVQILLMTAVPFALPRTFGRMAGDRRQGHAVVAVMAALALLSVTALNAAQLAHHGTVPEAVTAAAEGTEARFGVAGSATFAAATTLTSTGAVNSAHDSYTGLGGMVAMLDMMVGEVAPGGVGTGLVGLLVLAVVTVFVAGLMVGRTPEYLGKKIGPREIRLAALYFLVTPALALGGTALAMGLDGPRASMLNTGPHGLSEVLYAFTSAANNNGSAFGGLTTDTPFYTTALGLVMVLGRFVPIVLALALAGSLARQRPLPATAGTLPTHRPQFAALLAGVALVLVALTFLPALALGPLAEGMH